MNSYINTVIHTLTFSSVSW